MDEVIANTSEAAVARPGPPKEDLQCGDSFPSHGTEGCEAPPPSGDDGMVLLPKGTKVKISGNSRTKTGLINLVALVKKGIGLGGWHIVVLESGEEVKLQRNALTVLEMPAAAELDSSEDDTLPKSTEPISVTAMHPPAPTSAVTAAATKASTGQHTVPSSARHTPGHPPHHPQHAQGSSRDANPNPNPNPATQGGGCSTRGRSRRTSLGPPENGGRSKGTGGGGGGGGGGLDDSDAMQMALSALTNHPMGMDTYGTHRVNFQKLDAASLRKYHQYFNLSPQKDVASKEELVVAVRRHFSNHEVDEQDVVSSFLQAAKRVRVHDGPSNHARSMW